MKRFFIYIIMSGAALSAAAQATLTLAECREMALQHNKSLMAAKVQLEQTRYDAKSYKANFFPQISLMATDVYSTASGDIGVDPFKIPVSKLNIAMGQFQYDMLTLPDGSQVPNSIIDFPGMKEEWKVKNVFAGGIMLMQPLYMGGKISTAYSMSKVGVDMAAENIRLAESEVLVKTDEAYVLAVKAKQLGDVARSYKALLLELHKNVEAAVKHGMATRNDLMKVQVKLNEAELNIQKADNAYRLACMNLSMIIGRAPAAQTAPAGEEDLLLLSADELVAGMSIAPRSHEDAGTGVAVRPEASILEGKTELARQNVKLTRSEHLPNVMAGASYSYANGVELAGKKLIDGGAASVGVMVKVPIDIFGGATNKVRSAKAKLQIAQLEQQDLNEQMSLEAAQCENNVSEAQSELRLCQTAVAQAEENMKLSKAQYEVGMESLSDYLEAQAMWQQASANLVQARCQLLLAHTKYQKATGQLR